MSVDAFCQYIEAQNTDPDITIVLANHIAIIFYTQPFTYSISWHIYIISCYLSLRRYPQKISSREAPFHHQVSYPPSLPYLSDPNLYIHTPPY